MRVCTTWLASGIAFAAVAVAHDGTFCTDTAQTALQACRVGVNSDLLFAQAKCDNVADSTARTACQQQAQADSQTALQLCDTELAVRQAACHRLGEGRYDPVINPQDFTGPVTNPYFPLKPGTVLVYEGTTAGAQVRVEFAVTHNTVQILGVTAVEVHDSVFTAGELTEDTFDWIAQDRHGNVWYLGENTLELIDGYPSTLSGTFTAGVGQAKPGIIMGAHPVVGDFYRQEFDLQNAEDFAEVVSITETVTVPEGTFQNVVRTHETTPLEPDLKEDKWYAPGVGNILTRDLNTGEEIRLVDIRDDSTLASAAATKPTQQRPQPSVVKPSRRFRPF